MPTPSDKPLRDHVKLLGQLLGDTLRDQEGRIVLDTVENLRKGFIEMRRQPEPATDIRKRLMRSIAALNPEMLNHVVRAFSAYFNLANIAEEAFQHQQRRDQVRRSKPLWRGSFDETLRALRAAGVNAAQLQTLLHQLCFTPVFTAHPTEAKRRALLGAQRRIFVTNGKLDHPALNPYQRAEIVEELRSRSRFCGKPTRCAPASRRSATRSRMGCSISAKACSRPCPKPTATWKKLLTGVYGQEWRGMGSTFRVPNILRFGSWIGGDRDGNPFVTPDTTVARFAPAGSGRCCAITCVKCVNLSHVL